MSDADIASLRGQRILITGAARGIGAALAERLAQRGARLALVGSSPRRWPPSPSAAARETFVGECDVSDHEAVTGAIDAAAEALGGLDTVVANAGIGAGGPLRLQDVRSWERVIEINLLGVMYTDRAALPHLEASHGYLLNIASTAAALRAPGMTAYCAAKAGVEAMSDCLRIEMRPYGVDVGVAYFLFLDTDMVNDSEREMPMLQRARDRMPDFLGRKYPLGPGDGRGGRGDRRAPPPGRLPALVHEGARRPAAPRFADRRASGRRHGPGGDGGLRAEGRREGRRGRLGDRAHPRGRRALTLSGRSAARRRPR